MNHTNLIEKYFSKKLTEIELEEFDALYKNNPVFKDEVDFLNNVKTVSEKEDADNFKSQLKVFEEEAISKKVRNKNAWIKPFAAIAAIFLIALTVVFFRQTPINEDALFASYFEVSKNVSAPIVRSEHEETTVNNAYIAYAESNYTEAALLFEEAYQNSKASELLFYQGNALLANNDLEKAIETFNEHLNYKDILTNRSHWYLALAYLKNKDLISAKQELNTLINSGEVFKLKEAKSLLDTLD